jgi:hypothetical protein
MRGAEGGSRLKSGRQQVGSRSASGVDWEYAHVSDFEAIAALSVGWIAGWLCVKSGVRVWRMIFGSRARGTVVSHRRNRRSVLLPVIEFAAASGEAMTFTDKIPAPKWAIGHECAVAYAPADPGGTALAVRPKNAVNLLVATVYSLGSFAAAFFLFSGVNPPHMYVAYFEGVVSLLAGCFLGGAAVKPGVSVWRMIFGSRARGTVVSHQERPMHNWDRSAFLPLIEFVAASGETKTFTDKIPAGKWAIGRECAVAYAPADPAGTAVAVRPGNVVGLLIAMVMALAMFAGAFLCFSGAWPPH